MITNAIQIAHIGCKNCFELLQIAQRVCVITVNDQATKKAESPYSTAQKGPNIMPIDAVEDVDML